MRRYRVWAALDQAIGDSEITSGGPPRHLRNEHQKNRLLHAGPLLAPREDLAALGAARVVRPRMQPAPCLQN